jgi:acyl-[acyl-carrier-protein]-phospholipid O-acyltransferase / long-chain-fatty-acid--[acyl-carrier-protein] ligase
MNIKLLKIVFLSVIFLNITVDISHKILLQNIAFKIFDGSQQIVLISIINILILIPFLFLFSFSGYISDKYDKKDILVYGAISSFVLSIFMIFAYMYSSFDMAMIGLLLLGVQSAIYSPAKFGIIISLYNKNNLAIGNSYVQAISIIAILMTMSIFSFLFESIYVANSYSSITSEDILLNKFLNLTYIISIIALIEMCLSIFILKRLNTNFKYDNSNKTFEIKEYIKGKLLLKNLKYINKDKTILLCVIGLSFFWAICQGLVVIFPAYAKEYLYIQDVFIINTIIGSCGVGIAIGSYFYSTISKNYIEISTIVIGAIGMSAILYMILSVSSTSLLILAFLLFGFFGGLFIVPLNSLIQFNSNINTLGTVLAGNNWYQSFFMLIMLLVTTLISFYNISTYSMICILVFIALIGTIYTIIKLPRSCIYFFIKFIVGLKYKLNVKGLHNIPSSKGTLLLGNHISYIDWAIIQMSMPRNIHFVMDKKIYEKWYLNWILKFFNIIPISSRSTKNSIEQIAKRLDTGHIVVLFPEGCITRNGQLNEIKKGFEKIINQTTKDICINTFYIRGLWESMFSRANKKFKKSKDSTNIEISFSKPISKEQATSTYIKKSIVDLSVKSWEDYTNTYKSIPHAIFNKLKKIKSQTILQDSNNIKLSGYKFLTMSVIFKNILKKYISPKENVGLLLPTIIPTTLINTSILMLGKKAINLNYTCDISSLINSIKKANIKKIITSRKFIQKLENKGVDLNSIIKDNETLYIEDIFEKISKIKTILTLINIILLPTKILQKLYINKININQTAFIMFSSGSENTPKGIELSHKNILGNIAQMSCVLNIKEDDTIMASLPLFHAFGITVTTFLPLIEGIKTIIHPDPKDGLNISRLINQHKITILFGTSSFFRLYIINKKIHPLMLDSLRYIVSGAEKLSIKIRDEFKNRFGKNIMEGYGATETSPVASCNLTDIITATHELQIGNKLSTVGMSLPGTSIKITDPNTFEELKPNEEGMVLISGVQVMKGYLNDEEKTSSVIKYINNQRYYITGDKGRVDEDGFLTIVDRYSRFVKLAGEMISLTSIENRLSTIIDENIEYITISTKDDKKGEKIILLLSNITKLQLDNLKKSIIKKFDNKLMIPSQYHIIDDIPKLGSGKKDYNKAKQLYNIISSI